MAHNWLLSDAHGEHCSLNTVQLSRHLFNFVQQSLLKYYKASRAAYALLGCASDAFRMLCSWFFQIESPNSVAIHIIVRQQYDNNGTILVKIILRENCLLANPQVTLVYH